MHPCHILVTKPHQWPENHMQLMFGQCFLELQECKPALFHSIFIPFSFLSGFLPSNNRPCTCWSVFSSSRWPYMKSTSHWGCPYLLSCTHRTQLSPFCLPLGHEFPGKPAAVPGLPACTPEPPGAFLWTPSATHGGETESSVFLQKGALGLLIMELVFNSHNWKETMVFHPELEVQRQIMVPNYLNMGCSAQRIFVSLIKSQRILSGQVG